MPHGRLRSVIHALVLSTLLAAPAAAQEELRVASPDGRNVVSVTVRDGGLYYSLQRNGDFVLTPSRLGFAFRGADTLRDSLRITGSSRNTVDQTWTQPWGEVARVRDHHNELRVRVAEDRAPGRRFAVVFRAFDDGVGFRYEGARQDMRLPGSLTAAQFNANPRQATTPNDHGSLDSDRYGYWRVALKTFADDPVTGIGAGGFRVGIVQASGTPSLRLRSFSKPSTLLTRIALSSSWISYMVMTGPRLAATTPVAKPPR